MDKDSFLDSLNEWRGSIKHFLNKYHEIYSSKESVNELNRIIQTANEIKNKKPIVLIMGDSKAGKTSFLSLALSSNATTSPMRSDLANFLRHLISKNELNKILHLSFNESEEITISDHASSSLHSFSNANSALEYLEKSNNNMNQEIIHISLNWSLLRFCDIYDYPSSIYAEKKEELRSLFLNYTPYIVYFKDMSSVQMVTENILNIFNKRAPLYSLKPPISIIYTKKDEFFKITKEDIYDFENLLDEEERQKLNDNEFKDRLILEKNQRMEEKMKMTENSLNKYLCIENKNFWNLKEGVPSDEINVFLQNICYFIESRYDGLRKKFIVDSFHSVCLGIFKNLNSFEKNLGSDQTLIDLEMLKTSTIRQIEDCNELNKFLVNLEDYPSFEMKEKTFIQKLRNEFSELKNPSFEEFKKLLLKNITEKINIILQNNITIKTNNKLKEIYQKDITMEKFEISLDPNFFDSLNFSNQNKINKKRLFLSAIGVIALAYLFQKIKPLSFYDFYISIPISCTIAYVIEYFLAARKDKFKCYLELACKKISNKRLTIDETIKKQVVEILQKTIHSNKPEKQIMINNEFFEKIESEIISMKEKLIKGKK